MRAWLRLHGCVCVIAMHVWLRFHLQDSLAEVSHNTEAEECLHLLDQQQQLLEAAAGIEADLRDEKAKLTNCNPLPAH